MAWIQDPRDQAVKGPPPRALLNFVARRVTVSAATEARKYKIKIPKGMKPKGDLRDTLETALDNLCRELYKVRDIKDDVGTCISCGRLRLFRDLQWGHFIAQKQSQYLRWDPRNFGAQCIRCNIFDQGRQVDYGAELDRRYGKGFSEGLRQEARLNKAWHPAIKELEDKREGLKKMIEEIEAGAAP